MLSFGDIGKTVENSLNLEEVLGNSGEVWNIYHSTNFGA
jgi:hypothetical protein